MRLQRRYCHAFGPRPTGTLQVGCQQLLIRRTHSACMLLAPTCLWLPGGMTNVSTRGPLAEDRDPEEEAMVPASLVMRPDPQASDTECF
jgi:hypothetical protein